MVSESDQQAMEAIVDYIPKLSLLSLPSQPPEPPGSMSPPLRTSASVPFLWEEAPGKPRRCSAYNYATDDPPKEITTKSLRLPPRLLAADVIKFTDMPWPTTVLDGPDVGRSLSFTFSFRSPEESSSLMVGRGNGYFGSARWGSFRRSKGISVVSFDNSSSDDGADGSDRNGGVFGGGYDQHHRKVRLSRVRRRTSFLSLSRTNLSSHLLASIYESFKQVVPWRRKQEKQGKMTS